MEVERFVLKLSFLMPNGNSCEEAFNIGKASNWVWFDENVDSWELVSDFLKTEMTVEFIWRVKYLFQKQALKKITASSKSFYKSCSFKLLFSFI